MREHLADILKQHLSRLLQEEVHHNRAQQVTHCNNKSQHTGHDSVRWTAHAPVDTNPHSCA